MSQRSKNAPTPRPIRPKRDQTPPPGKRTQDAPRLIGYGILLLALLLIVIGSLLA
jgi:hypothetical protein